MNSAIKSLQTIESLETSAEGKHTVFGLLALLSIHIVEYEEPTGRKRKRSQSPLPVSPQPTLVSKSILPTETKQYLNNEFDKLAYPTKSDYEALSKTLNLDFNRVKKWFSNRRHFLNSQNNFRPLTDKETEALEKEFNRDSKISRFRSGQLAADFSRKGENIFSGQIVDWFKKRRVRPVSPSVPDRVLLDEQQTIALQTAFIENQRPDAATISQLAVKLNLAETNVNEFFKRNRAQIRNLATDPSFTR